MTLARSFCIFIFAVMFLSVALSAQAKEASAYASLGLAFGDVDSERGLNSEAILLRGGYDFNVYLGVEAEALLGVGEGEVTSGPNFRATDKLNSQFGAYGILNLPLSDNFSLFTRAGIATLSEESTSEFQFENGEESRFEFDNTITGPSFGIGARLMFGKTRRNGVRFDATGIIGLSSDDDELFDDGSGYIGLSYIRRF